MIVTEERLKRLPLWAQQHIAHLEEGYTLGSTLLQPTTQISWRLAFGQLGPGEHYLPDKAIIRFHLGGGKDIELTLEGETPSDPPNTVRVYTYHGRPVVKIQASNILTIQVDD